VALIGIGDGGAKMGLGRRDMEASILRCVTWWANHTVQ